VDSVLAHPDVDSDHEILPESLARRRHLPDRRLDGRETHNTDRENARGMSDETDNPSALLVGESWQTIEFHVKGFDQFSNASYTEAVDDLRAALETDGIETTYQPCHVAATEVPDDAASLAAYDVVVLSDIGYNTLAIPPATFARGERRANRLRLLDAYVRAGGGLLMIGGYLSFQGIDGRANYGGTPVEEILPVSLLPGDDRVERADGVVPEVLDDSHPVTVGLSSEWPYFLGYNRVTVDDDATELVQVDDDPLVAVGTHGDGRSAVFTSDCAPHWGPQAFVDWEGYDPLWVNLIRWLAG
jgi:uncharacterized membrane protein